MVAVVSGSGLGLFNSSTSTLGSAGRDGDTQVGRGRDQVLVNTTTGNLIVQSVDDTLAAIGLDFAAVRTYNSQGLTDEDNNDQWRLGVHQKVALTTGTVNMAGSVVTKTFGDGTAVAYAWNATRSRYESTDGDGANDYLTWNGTNSTWTWTDGSSLATEEYGLVSTVQRLKFSRDADGNTVTYAYTGSLLTSLTMANPGANPNYLQTVTFAYTGTDLTSIAAASWDGTIIKSQTLTSYGYDASHRLTSVTVDLTPLNTADSLTYTTTYTYDSTSKRIASITQKDGSSLAFTYQNLNGNYRVKTIIDGEGRQTTFNYSSVIGTPSIYQQTDVVDALGLTTTYLKDTSGRLISVKTPAVGGAQIETRYTYDATTGNVATITQDPTGLNRVTTFAYDAITGQLLNTRDSLGNTVARTYNTNNQLDTETSYLVRDPDGAGTGVPSSPLVSRYVYDAENHLRFSVSADGRVTEHVYDGPGQRTTTYGYAASTYSGTYTEAALSTWATGQRGSALQRVDYAYDFRGNVSTITAWAATDSAGVGTGPASTTRFIYDQRGMLLSTVEARGEATATPTTDYVTNYTYDGLGRVLTQSTWVSSTETARPVLTNSYDDTNRRTVSTFANGLTKTSNYNRDGELTSVVMGPAALGTTSYTYDAGGRLRVVTDQTNVKTYSFYDEAGRLIGSVDGDGSLTEIIYNRAHQVIKAVRYATLLTATTQTNLAGGSWSSVLFSTLRTEANTVPASNQITRNVYDVSGTLVYTVDQIGAVTQNIYDGAGRLTDQVRFFNTQTIPAATDEVLPAGITVATNAADRRTRFFYNGDGQLLGTLDGAGYLKENVYDAAGRLTSSVGYYTLTNSANWLTGSLATLRPALDAARDITTRYFYDAQGRQVGQLDGEGYLTENVYDVADNVTQSIRYNRVLTFTVGTSTFATLKTAAAGATTHTSAFTYDGLGQVLTETNFENTQTLYSYDIAGNLVSTTRANGVSAEARTTATRYDVLGRVTQELTAEGSAALAALGGSPTQTQIDDVWSKYGVLYTYDNASRRTSATVRPNDTQTNTTYFYYDNDGRLRFELDARGRVTESRYNALGQVVDRIEYYRTVSIASPTGGLLTSALITSLTATESANVHEKTTYGYSLRGEITSTLTAAGATTSMGYNVFGELATQNAGSGFTAYDYTYDARGLQKLTKRGATTFEDRTYDAFGRLGTVIDARGNTFTTTFDRLGREITSAEPGDANARVTTYDGFSRVLTVRDKLLNTTTYAYNDSTRTLTITTPESIVVTTVHNRHGETLSVTANGNTTSYVYDLNGKLTSSSDGLGTLEGRAYDRAGRQVTATDARGVITTLAYDAANRLLTRTVDSAAGGLQLVTTYTYDTLNRTLDVTEPGNRLTRTQYDRDGRVSSVIEDPNGTTPRRTDYTYDAANNTTLVTEGVASANPRRTQYVYDALGRRTHEYVDPTSLGGTLNLHTEYRYDNNDNVTRKIDARGNSTWYVYDTQNRLTQTIDALGGVTQLTYDSEDRVTVTRRYFNTAATGSLGDAPAAQSVTTTLNDHVSRSVYDRDGRTKYSIDTSSATGSPGAVTETAVVTERTFDAGGNVTRTRIYRTAITVPATVNTSTIPTALTAAGNSTSTLHANDRVQWTAYDVRGRAVFTVDGTGAVAKTTFDASGNVIASIEYATTVALTNLMTTASLTTWSNQSAIATHASNRNTSFWYDTLNRARFTLDAEGYLVETRYLDSAKQQQTVTYFDKPTIASGATMAQVVSAANGTPNPSSNQITTRTYDVAGRTTQVTDANGASEYFVYDAVGNKIKYVNKKATGPTDPAYTWTYDYDANHRLTYERSPSVTYASVNPSTLAYSETTAQVVTRNDYDSLGNVTARTEAYGTGQARVTRFEYDLLGRQTATVSPTVGVYSIAGDTTFGNGATVAATETQTEIRSETSYDVFGNAFRNRLVAANLASVSTNGTYNYKTYDNLGRVTYEVDALNQVTGSKYDVFGNKFEMTRYVNPLGSTTSWQTASSLVTSQVGVSANTSVDRAITSTFDRLGRALSVKQPSVRNFAPAVNGAGGSYYNAQPDTEYVYNAFGDVIRTSKQINTVDFAHTYSYYDKLGRKSAELDPNRYLTLFEYDETGDLTRKLEYARPTTGTVDYSTYGTKVTTTQANQAVGTPESFAGYDRETTYIYDKLNQKTSESKRNLEYASISAGTLSTLFNGVQTTTYGYDVLGNQTRVTDALGGTTYSFYDVLGRQVATAGPSHDLGLGTSKISFTRMARDANGNLIQQVEYFNGLASNVFGATPPDAPAMPALPTTHADDRTTTIVVDNRGNATRTRDANGADRYASYNERGDIAKEWQVVFNPMTSGTTTDDVTETIVKIYRYDAVGQTKNVVESQRYNGANTDTVTRVAEYNAFGDIIYKYNQGTADAEKQFFDYDQAGRVWRTTGEDGIDKVYMYDLAGNATLELRSTGTDLSAGRTLVLQGTYTSAQGVVDGVSALDLLRTETVYDATGNVVQRRMPSYDVDTRYRPVATDIAINTFSGLPYVYWTPPPANSGATTFWYRLAGSTGSYTQLTIESVAGGKAGVNVNALSYQTYEFRMTATFLGDEAVAAESLGTFRVDRATVTNYSSITLVPPDTSLDVQPIAIQQSGPINLTATPFQSEGWLGTYWYPDNVLNCDISALGNVPVRVFVQYSNWDHSTPTVPHTTTKIWDLATAVGVTQLRWQAAAGDQFGGLMYDKPIAVTIMGLTAVGGTTTGTIAQTNAPAGPPMLIWNAPADISVTAVFKYKRTADSSYSSTSVARFGGGQFRLDVANLLTSTSNYDYEIEYWKSGAVVSRRGGQMNSTGVTTTRYPNGTLTDAVLNAWSQNIPTPAVGAGYTLQWAAPPSTWGTVSASFGVRPNGDTGAFSSRTITTGSTYSVDLSTLPLNTPYEYQIVYTLGGRTIAEQRGVVNLQYTPASTTTNVTAVAANSAPTPILPVSPLSGSSGVGSATGDRYTPIPTWMPAPYNSWTGPNGVDVGFPVIPTSQSQYIKIGVYYTFTGSGSSTAYYELPSVLSTATGFSIPGGGTWTPGTTTSTARFSWSPGTTSSGRALVAVTDVVVYLTDSAGNNKVVARRKTTGSGSGSAPVLQWAAPTQSGLSVQFYVNGTLRTSTLNGSTWSGDVSGYTGTNNYEVRYLRSGDPQAIVAATGQFASDSITTSMVGTQTAIDRNPSWLTAVGLSGNTVTWSRVADQGAYMQFEYSTDAVNYAPLTIVPSGDNTNFSASVQGFNTGRYYYRLTYASAASGVLPYVKSEGYFDVVTTVVNNTTILDRQNPHFNQQYGPARIQPVTLPANSDVVSWSYLKNNTSDTVMFFYTVGGTEYTVDLSGTVGASYSATMSALPIAANQPVTWRIEYRTSGQYQYAMANGTATITVTGTQQNPVVSGITQALRYPSGVQPLPAPTDLGGEYLGWSSLSPNAGATVKFYLNGVETALETVGSTRRINLASLTAATYNYELTFTESGAITWRAIGTFAVVKTPGAISNTTVGSTAARVDTAMSFVPTIGMSNVVNPPWASYHLVTQTATPGYVLAYGAAPWSATENVGAGGWYYYEYPSPENPNGTRNQLPQSLYFYGSRLAITIPMVLSFGVELSVDFWLLSDPSNVKSAGVSNPDGSINWVADIQGPNGIANGSYGYRIKLTRQGAQAPIGVMDGTFVVGSTNSITVSAAATPAPVVVTPTTKQSFDRWGNLIQATDAANNITDYRYNGLNLLVQTLEAFDWVYDKRDVAGNKATDGIYTRVEKTNSYDLLGRLIETQDGYDQANRVSYNNAGQQLTKRNADYARYTSGATSANVYDTFGNLRQTQDELGYLTRYKYDKLGRLTEVWREIDLNVFTNRTDATVLTVANSALVQSQIYKYDEAGRRIAETNGANETIRYRYDFLGNLTLKRTNLGYITSYVYNADGKKTSETDAIGSAASWVYNAFGQLTSHTEFNNASSSVGTAGGTVIGYTYTKAGQMATQTGGGQNVTYAYDRGGNLASIRDATVNRDTRYRYDIAGRQARETVAVDGRLQQDTRITYDNHNRIKGLDDPDYREGILFDVNGNRAYVYASYAEQEQRKLDETYRYTYDEMNRITTDITYLGDAQQNLITDYTYNARGDRILQVAPGTPWAQNGSWYKKANGFTARVDEAYSYDGLGRLLAVNRNLYHTTSGAQNPTNIPVRSYTYDLANRQKTEQVKSVESDTAFVSRDTTTNYDGDGRTISQSTTKSTNGGTAKNESSVSYGTGRSTYSTTWSLGFDDANNLRGYEVQNYDASGSATYKTTYKTDYYLSDGYLENKQTADSVGSGAPQPPHGETQRFYNANHELIKFTDQVAAKSRYFVSNQGGQVLESLNINSAVTDVNTVWNSAMLHGQLGNQYANGTGQHFFFAQGNKVGSRGEAKAVGQRWQAHFDVNSTPISDNYPAATPATVIAQAGDTARTVAQRVLGDASLWYVIAEENGLLDPDADLTDGMQLRIPNEVISLSNTANSFKPYSITDVLGDTTPTQAPPPAPKDCGLLGQFIMAVVAMVVMCFLPALAPVLGPILSGALTAAVGSAITQGIGIALGIQEKFDWKQVGMAALSAGVTKGMVRLGDSVPAVASFFEKIGSAGQAIVGNVVTQGIAVATKLQPSFSWRSVAAAAVSAEIGKVDTGITEALAGHVGERLASLTDKFVSNVGTSLAQAAFGGKVDLAAIVVDAFGNAVGNSIVDTLKNFENSKVPDRPAREIKAIGKDEIMKMPDTVLADLNASMGMPNIGSTYIAQRGDSISKIVGTSDPAAIGAFMRANGLTSSEIFAGQEYELPTDSYTRADARLGQSALNADNARLAEAREISAQIDGWVHEGIDAITPNALDRAASQAFDQLFVNAMHQYAAEEEYRNNPYAGRSGVSLYYQALGMTPGAPDILGAVAALDDFTRSPTVVRIGGAARAIGGVSEMSFGAAFEGAPIAGQIFGTAVIWHGADQTQAGLKELIYGEPTDTFSIRGMINAGMDASWARGIDGTASILLGGVAPLARSAGLLDDIFYPSQYVARQTLGELPSTLTFGADSRALSEWSEAAKLGTYRDLNLTIWERGLLAQERELAEAANWTRPNGKTWWPPYDGAIPGTQRVVTLKPGVEPVSGWVDRYGSTAGRFISPDGLPWSSRALPGTQSGVPNLYEIKGAVPGAMKGVISPWFGQRGLGTQYELVFDVQTYLKAQRFE